MKKLIAVLIAGTFIIGTAVAQTPSATPQKPVAKKEAMASTTKMSVKKATTGVQKSEGKKKHRKGGKGKGKKVVTAVQKTK